MTSARFPRLPVALAVAGAVVASLPFILAASASAAGVPSWRVSSAAAPTDLPPGGTGIIEVRVANIGTAATDGSPVTVEDVLPAGMTATEAGEFVSTGGEIGNASWDCSGIGTGVVTCTNDPVGLPVIGPGPGGYASGVAEFRGGHEAPAIGIVVAVPATHSALSVNRVTLSGGGAPSAADASQPIAVAAGPAPFSVTAFDPYSTGADGLPATQAGSHPFALTTEFTLSNASEAGALIQNNDLKDISVSLPPGLIGNPETVPKCTRQEFDGTHGENAECPTDSEIGEAAVEVGGLGPREVPLTVPLFNLTPPTGYPAQFGFRTNGISTFLDVSLRTGKDYGVDVKVGNAAQRQLLGARVTVWGVPADPVHDPFRCNIENETSTCGLSAGVPPKPFLTLPTACAFRQEWSFSADTWLAAGGSVSGTVPAVDGQGNPVDVDGCNQVGFSPTIQAKATTNVADAPTGYRFDLHIPQNEATEGLAEAELKGAVVTLPPGLVVNPSSANGLGACTEAQIELSGPNAPTCPEAAKIGNVEVDTPLIGHPLPGGVYLARPEENPFGSLLAIYIVVDDPASGVIVKLPGEVRADPTTGQLTTFVKESPQLPFEDFHLDFFEGSHAPLRSPSVCGRYQTSAAFTPWTSPEGAEVDASDSFETVQAPNGGACPTSAAQLPDSPNFTAGTITPKAGVYSPFVLHLARADGTQELTKIETTLPEGLLAKLAGVSECPDAAIAQAAGRNKIGEGALEQAHPSCPQSSEVGVVHVGAGAGPTPYYVSGHAYLAGPYKGAPLSLAIVTPAVAGPYDLGDVVVRTALQVDPLTAQVDAVSDEIPHILQGIPLDVRSIDLELSRSNFTVNPTSCEKKSITGTATALTGSSAPLSVPFQVGECKGLAFKPKLKLSLKGSTKHAGHPALKAVLTYPKGAGYANIARAQVNLPHSEFIDQGNLNKTCTRPVLLAGACPASTVYGHAEAWTPLEEAPLAGPVFLVGGFGYKLPALVAELNGQIRVLLVGKVDSGKNHGIRTTFEAVPDAPVEKFVLAMKGGPKYSLLENSEPLCAKPQKAIAAFTAQNGLVDNSKVPIQLRCPKGKRPKKGKPKAAGKKSHGHRKSTGKGDRKRSGTGSALDLNGLLGGF